MNPFSPPPFTGRNKELRRIVGRINTGQSTAINGEPRIGKTSILRQLADPTRYGDLAQKLLFQYLDAQTFSMGFTSAQFWHLATTPLREKLTEINNPALTTAYETCEKEEFGVYGLEKVLTQMNALGYRLVMLFDEFDNLLDHPVLHKSEFYGGLRSLASRYLSLTLVTASRQPLETLNSKTQEYSQLGSPYFNFMTPATLGSLDEKESLKFLGHGDEHFKKADREYLSFIAGGHPYFLQIAAAALWDAYEDAENGARSNQQTRWENTARELHQTVRQTLANSWELWTPETQKTIAIIALDTIPSLVQRKQFDIESLLASFGNYSLEVEDLQKRGILAADSTFRTGYRLQSQVILWWLAGELLRLTRPKDDAELGESLNKQEWVGGLMKREELGQLKKALSLLGGLLQTGSETFIKIAVESFAKRILP